MRSVSLAFFASLFSLEAMAASVCEPIQNSGCSAYPAQAQIIATVTATEASVLDGQDVCSVSVKPNFFQAHGLCPMSEEDVMTYVVCGACPEVGEQVSGVLMMDPSGSVRLDR